MTTYTPNFLYSQFTSGTPDVYVTGAQDYTGLTDSSGSTKLVLGQGYFTNFDATSSYTLDSNSWAGIGLFSEALSTNAAWEPQGSYFLSETAYVTPSAKEVGGIKSITVTNYGSGYTSEPIVTITGGGGNGAAAEAVLSGTTVGSITVTNAGSGYTSAPTVTVSRMGADEKAQATATVSDDSQRVDSRLSRITSGSLYFFYVGGASRTNLTVDATADSKPISFGNSQTLATTMTASTDEANIAYIIRRADQNTEIAPFRYSGGAITSGQVGSVTVTNSGSAYTSAPDVTFTGGEGSGATATAVLSGTTVGSITVTNPGSGYTSVPDVNFTGGGGNSDATADASLIGNLQNIMMASEGATDHSNYEYDITPQKAVVSRSIGDLYTFNYPERGKTDYETYDFATGGDGVVAIGATDSFASVSEDGASDSAFTGTPFEDSSTGNFDWPATSEIQISDAGFLYSDLKKIFKSRSYGHSYNMDLGLNFDLGTNDGNDINLATNWSYSNFFRGDAAKRYAMADGVSDKPASKSGWKIHSTFDVDLTSGFPVSGIDEAAVKAFVAIKNGFGTAFSPASWIALLFHAGDKDEHPLPKNAWQAGLPDNLVAGPADSDGNQLITDDNFKDYSESTETTELESSFGLTPSRLSVERSVGATASYTKGDSHSIWKNKTGTSSIETKFPASGGSDGEWGYWERSNFDNMTSYSQTGTINATTSSITKVSSDVIDREITSSTHSIDFGFTWVPYLSLGINLHGVKTSFGHTPPSKVNVDVGFTRMELDIKGVNTVIKMNSIVNLTKMPVDENKITYSGGKNKFFFAPFVNKLTGAALKAKHKSVGAELSATGTKLSSQLMTSLFVLTETKAAASEGSAKGVDLVGGNTVVSGAVGGNPSPEPEPTPAVVDPPPAQVSPVAAAGTNDKQPKAGSSLEPNNTEGASTSTPKAQTQAAATGPVNRAGKPLDAMHIARLKRFDPTFTP